MIEKDFKNTIIDIKKEIQNAQIMIMSDANKRLIQLYFRLGKIIYDNSTWGNKFIDNLTIELKVDFPNIKGFSARNLKRMKKFYTEYKEYEIVPMALAQLTWSHNNLLIDKIKNKEIREWYRNETINNNWSVIVLEHQIDINLYERKAIACKSNNFKNTLIDPQSDLANDLQKDPYIFNLPLLKNKYIETELENAMVERIKDVLLELGNGFSFVGNQYKITVGEDDYFIDMLFYHLKLRCYIVVELKNTKFKPEYAEKLNFYLSAVDDKLRNEYDNSSIGIILCKGKNKFEVEYSLKDINKPIVVSSYEISKVLPAGILDKLPTEEDINLHFEFEDGDI